MADILTVQVELPEGVSVSTYDYRYSHGKPPSNEFGVWAFTPLDTEGEHIELGGRTTRRDRPAPARPLEPPAVNLATSSYAAWQPEDGTPVRITLGLPRWPRPPGRERWIYVSEVAPRPWYFRAAPEKFDRMYLSQLDRLAADIETKLAWLAERFDGPLVLCCFERKVRPGDCHRLLFSRWWTERTGQPVPELDPKGQTP